uniref:PDZ domain-containing protein n=1 Tax=Salarias fasciatus TaxID=181472 RepID=A0A672JI48_SALFA
MSKSLKKKNHWTNKVHEAVITRGKDGELGFELKGGAENGQFPYFGEVKQGKGLIQSGKLAQDELLLEVNDMPVAGLTTRDVLAVIKHCKDPVRFKCVKQGGVVDKDLRHYLNLRFSKGSVDHDHQQIIRDNLYLRTVPCDCTLPEPLSSSFSSSLPPSLPLSCGFHLFASARVHAPSCFSLLFTSWISFGDHLTPSHFFFHPFLF